MNKTLGLPLGLFLAALLAGCASTPTGPSLMALPGSGKNFDQFRADDMSCRQYAQYQMGGVDANQAAVDAGLRSAAVGAAVGAVAGTLIGGNQQGAAAGAGAGLLLGGVAGTGAAEGSARASQRGYDHAYVQCMYAKGNQVPIAGGGFQRQRVVALAPAYPAVPPDYIPPPPPGSPPPPPAAR